MSVDEHNVVVPPPASNGKIINKVAANETFLASPADNAVQTQEKRWYTWLLSPLWLCLLVAVIIRIWLIMRTHGTLDGDEALLGIQAEHILQGERPIYFYGIPYFGSLEAYVAAILFAIFGPSVTALRAETTAFSLVLVSLTWWLASLLAKAARLPLYARRCFIIVAALVAALPPLYDGIVELRTGGGWIESFVLMLLLLISVYRLTTRWHEGAYNRELALRWAGVGFIVGFSMWIYPLVSVAIVAAALWVIIDRFAEIIKRVRASEPIPIALMHSLKGLLLAVTAIPACVVGFTPGIIWGATHQWQNIRYIFGLGGGWTIHRLHTVAQVASSYTTCVGPRIISGATPLESGLLTVIHSPLLIIGVLCTLGSVVLIAGSFIWHYPVLLRARRLATLPALFGTASAVLFCVSSASASILISCQDDFGGRYAAPLVMALPFFFATIFTLLSMSIYEKRPGRQTGGATHATDVQLSSGTSRQRTSVALVGLFVLLFAYLAGQTTTYGLTNPDLAFQSPWCTIAPANYEPIIAYMEQEHIQYAWATNLLAYPISFKTNNKIIMADPVAIMHPDAIINRIPSYTDAVNNADRPSFLIFVKHGDPHPDLLQVLDGEHVTYKTALFPSQPGVDVMVVTPLSRTISLLESNNLDIFYCSAR
ncbi:hypothetical protein [Ktedonobacter racemifer]|uniref:Glycosyltransferase RgtA/B/C/D-like domain-containing protein n=1 Tax=Ktedonobacter racemifer DSM 44963 TaxID=485913 RepID=D6TTM6_KTERA|nr:hypothetical protein [Ktedonobacter racemifer]EFH83777.1 hypothetical protein Krac_4773 [Ktedonobacter racemifer DSM 44963]